MVTLVTTTVKTTPEPELPTITMIKNTSLQQPVAHLDNDKPVLVPGPISQDKEVVDPPDETSKPQLGTPNQELNSQNPPANAPVPQPLPCQSHRLWVLTERVLLDVPIETETGRTIQELKESADRVRGA